MLFIETLNLSSTFLGVIAAVGGGILSFLFGIIMERYRNRRINIVYELTSTVIGLATKSDLWGDVRLIHNDIEMDSLYLFKLRITNNSNFDTDSLPVNISCDVQSSILSHSSFHSETQTGVLLDQPFYNGMIKNQSDITSFIKQHNEEKDLPNEIAHLKSYYEKNKNFMVEVFNRNGSCEFNLLVGSTIPNTKSELFFNIPKKSVQLSQLKNKQESDKVVGTWSLLLGATITIVSGIILYWSEVNYVTSIIILVVIGCSSFLLGFMTLRIFDFIKSFFK